MSPLKKEIKTEKEVAPKADIDQQVTGSGHATSVIFQFAELAAPAAVGGCGLLVGVVGWLTARRYRAAADRVIQAVEAEQAAGVKARVRAAAQDPTQRVIDERVRRMKP